MTNEATTPSGQPLGISHKPSKSGAMFTKFKAENKPAFIGYLPYGFPNPDVSLDAFRTMVEHGVDAWKSACRTPTRSWTARSSRLPPPSP